MGGGGFGSGGGRGGWQRMGRQKGNAPRDANKQSKQFERIVKSKNLTPKEIEQLHREISGKGYGYHEIIELINDMFGK